MKKRLLAIIMCIAILAGMVSTVSAADGTMTVEPSTTTADAGVELTFKVSFSGVPDITSLAISMNADSVFTAGKGAWKVGSNWEDDGIDYAIRDASYPDAVAAITEATSPNFFIFQHKFTVSSSAASGTYKITFTPALKNGETAYTVAPVTVEVTVNGVAVVCAHDGETYLKNEKPATCKEEGYSGDVYCKLCDEKIEDGKTLEKLAHKPGEAKKENEAAATCKAAGGYDMVTRCTECNEIIKSEHTEVAKLPHTPKAPVEEDRKEATCKDEGSYDEVVYCDVCGEEISRETKKLDKLTTHTPGEAKKENEVAATCKAEGSYDEVVHCEVCGEIISSTPKTTPKTEHTAAEPVKEKEVAATCKEGGSYEEVVYCKDCGTEMSREKKTTDKLDTHTPDPEKENVIKPASCTEAGKVEHTCSVCGHTWEEELEKLAHKPKEAVKENEVAPTCKTEGSYEEVVRCEDCDGEISRETKKVDKLPHTPKEAVKENEVAPTCKAEGSYELVEYCEVCGEEVSRKTEKVAKLPHTPGDPEEKVTKEPTATAEGEKTITTKCKDCGEIIEEKKEAIPATGKETPTDKPADPNTPSTGDRAMILVWLGILGISGAALVVLSKKRRYSVK